MISEGRIPLSKREHTAVEKLIADNPGKQVSLTRRDPGDTGPVLVYVDEKTYRVAGNGRVTEVK